MVIHPTYTELEGQGTPDNKEYIYEVPRCVIKSEWRMSQDPHILHIKSLKWKNSTKRSEMSRKCPHLWFLGSKSPDHQVTGHSAPPLVLVQAGLKSDTCREHRLTTPHSASARARC